MWRSSMRVLLPVALTHLRRGRQYSSPVRKPNWTWIPVSSGIGFLALFQLARTYRRERAQGDQPADTWQLTMFRLIPARILSRAWGSLNRRELPVWLRRPLLSVYVWVFGCDMKEAVVEDLADYSSLTQLFTRQLKPGVRAVSTHHQLVSPSDGKVLHYGVVKDGRLEQVKGVTYDLSRFLGQEDISVKEGNQLYHIIVYLAPGDYHHFHSPVDWRMETRKHFPGELLTVAPWAARSMPGLFSLNERVVLLGEWEHGFFSMAAVGAFNVGSMQMAHDKELQTNMRGRYIMGHYTRRKFDELFVTKGERIGGFNLGSSIILIFEAPKDFKFSIEANQRLKYGQPLSTLLNKT